VIALAVAYAAAWLPCARWLFRRWRAGDAAIRSAANTSCRLAHDRYGVGSCCYRQPANRPAAADSHAAAWAMGAATLWPLALLAMAVRWSPRDGLRRQASSLARAVLAPSRYSEERRKAQRDAFIAAAEIECDLAGRDPLAGIRCPPDELAP
jgi:hypothetical protein